jgi:glycosyltransferase involved in cell wall biosynthesis
MTGAGYGTFAQRLNIMGKALSDVDVLIAPSISTKEIYESVFPGLREKIVVMPYFLPRRQPRPCSRRGDKLRVLIAGMISRHKGGFDLRTVMDQLPDDDIEFHICGDLIPDIKAMLDPLLTSRRNITFHGPYLPGALPRPFYECDVALFLSIWPETYLIALTEAMRAGCVPIVTSIGAHGDRIVHGENGFKVEVGDPSAVIRILRGLLVDRAPLAGMKLRSQSTPTTSVSDYVAFLQARLDGGLAALSRPEGLGGQVLANVDLGISMPAAAAAPPPIQRRSALFYSRRLWSIYKSEGAEVALKKIVSYGHARLRTRIARSA